MLRCKDVKMHSLLHKSNFDILLLFSSDMNFASMPLRIYASMKGILK